MGLPSGGVAGSIEDVARFVHAVLYSPQAPWHAWSYNTQQALTNNVDRAGYTPAGWTTSLDPRANGLQLWKNGGTRDSNSLLAVWPAPRVGLAVLNQLRSRRQLGARPRPDHGSAEGNRG
jgi:hypothetical protein